MNIEAGDILLTRHADEAKNTSPGHWNHAAMYVGNNTVVEAQEGPDAVLSVDWPAFYSRYAEVVILRPKMPWQVRDMMAWHAWELVGSTYRKFASIFRFLRGTHRGENCVSVVRKAFKQATGYDPKWKKPDDIYQDRGLTLVAKK
jgi:uncharacterized protein YycO